MTTDEDDPNEISTLDGDLRLGDFLVRPLLKQVIRLDDTGEAVETHNLPDKALGVLIYLMENARQVCEREAILDAVWGEDRQAYDRVLDTAVAEIRRAFGDDARDPSYIQTIPKRGYRLVQAVHPRSPGPCSSERTGTQLNSLPSAKATSVPSRGSARRVSPAVAMGLILGGGILLGIASLSIAGSRDDQALTVSIERSEADSSETDLRRSWLSKSENHLRTALFGSVCCDDDVQFFRPDPWWRSPDIEVALNLKPVHASSPDYLLTASISAGDVRELVSFNAAASLQTTPAGTALFTRQVVEALHQVACDTPGVEETARARHCLEASQTLEGTVDPQHLVRNLQRAVKLNPDLMPAYSALAQLLQNTGETSRSLQVLKNGLDRIDDPESTPALALRLELARSLRDSAEEGRLLNRLHLIDPEDWHWAVLLARYLTAQELRCEQALEVLDPFLEQKSGSASITFERSFALQICGQRNQSIAVLEQEVKRLPLDQSLRKMLAGSLSLVGRFEEARQYAQEALALQPFSSEPYWLLGLIAERAGHYSAAESWYDRALEQARWPRDRFRVSMGRARIAWLSGDPDACLELLRDSEEPTFYFAHESPSWQRGMCHLDLGEVQQARAALNEVRPGSNDSSAGKANGFAFLLEVRLAVAVARTESESRAAVSRVGGAEGTRSPRLDLVRQQSGHLLASLGLDEPAEAHFLAALEQNPNHPWAHCDLGLLYLRQGRVQDASRHMERAIQVFGNPPEDPLGRRCAEELRLLQTADAETTD